MAKKRERSRVVVIGARGRGKSAIGEPGFLVQHAAREDAPGIFELEALCGEELEGDFRMFAFSSYLDAATGGEWEASPYRTRPLCAECVREGWRRFIAATVKAEPETPESFYALRSA